MVSALWVDAESDEMVFGDPQFVVTELFGGIGLAQRQVEHPGRGGREVGAHVQEQSEGPVAHTCDSGHGSRLANPN